MQMTKGIERALEKAPLHSKEGQGKNAKAIACFYTLYKDYIYIVTEGEKQSNGEWLLGGYFCSMDDWLWENTWKWEYKTLGQMWGTGAFERDARIHPNQYTVEQILNLPDIKKNI